MADNTSKPARLYKYEAFTERSLQNLKGQVIYFSSPKDFNDPYDCALNPVIDTPSDQEVEAFRDIFRNRSESKNIFDSFSGISTQGLREVIFRSTQAAIDNYIANFLHRGFSCFSEVNNELLMWSHYAGRYKGFCLEFDTAYPPFEKMTKVKYSTTMPHIDAATLLLTDDFEAIIDLCSTKSISWSYEREWRVLHTEAGTAYHYPTECLTGIYFGPEISFEALEIICLVMQGQNPHIRFWRGRRSNTEFKVEFDEFTYTPNLKIN